MGVRGVKVVLTCTGVKGDGGWSDVFLNDDSLDILNELTLRGLILVGVLIPPVIK